MLRTLVPALLALSSVGIAIGVDHPPPGDPRLPQPPWMRRAGDANLPDLATRRARLVAQYCGQCHAPPPPELHSGDQWRWLIVRMDMRAWAANRPSVHVASNDELREIATYYATHADD